MSERPTLKRGTSTSGSAYASSSGYTAFQQQPQQPQQHSSYYPTQRPPSFLYPDNQSYDPTASSRALVYRSPPYGHGQYYSAAPTESSYLPRSSNSAYNHTPSWFASSSSQQLPFSLSGTDSKDPSNPYYADPDASRLGSETGKGYSYSGLGAVVKMYERSPHSSSFMSYSSKSSSSSDATTTATSPGSAASSSSTTSNTRRSSAAPGVPLGFDHLLHPLPSLAPPPPPLPAPSSSSQPQPQSQNVDNPTSRFSLRIRQQPVAARACGAGDKDRRPIDPPPILQMLLTNFNPDSEDDINILRDPCFVVGCLLYSVTHRPLPPPSSRSSTTSSSGCGMEGVETEQRVHMSQMVEPLPSYNTPASIVVEDPSGGRPGRTIQVLSGRTFASPFFVDEDPDPNTAPAMYPPITTTTGPRPPCGLPATFFVFADLSVRTAGLYRLLFRLTNFSNIGGPGESKPILAEIWSEPFRVHAAKDFPGMQESSYLTERLKALGVVELKMRGKGKGKGNSKVQ